MINSGLTLGGLINELKRFPSDSKIVYDFCDFYPSGLASYRGYYEDLALGFSRDYDDKEAPTVKEILNVLEQAIGKEFYGYKGGNYKAGKNSALWVSLWGETNRS